MAMVLSPDFSDSIRDLIRALEELTVALGNFVPRGSEQIPAMLTPGEGILNNPAMLLRGTDEARAIELGREVARSILRHADEIKRHKDRALYDGDDGV